VPRKYLLGSVIHIHRQIPKYQRGSNMANTYTQLYVQIVFAVQGRLRLIPPAHREELQKYITGIVQNQKNKMLAVNCMPDHTHIVIGWHPDTALSALVRDVKACSSSFISQERWCRSKFAWQSGFGAFSYSRCDLDNVVRYVRNQQQHHQKKKFRDEYIALLNEYGVEYDPRYIFEDVYVA
jgi:putative transposase